MSKRGPVIQDANNVYNSIAPGSSGQILQSGGSSANPAYTTNTYPATSTQGDLLYASANNTISALAKNTSATRYLANTGTSNAPAWNQVALGTGVSGTLPIANGGTNSTSFTQSNGIVTYNGTSLVNYAGPQINSSGRMTNTSQPAFRVYNNAVQTDVTGDGTDYTTLWTTAQFDQTSSFDFANARYQCPVTGKYLFSCCLNLLQVGAGHTQGRAWFNNSTANEYQFFWQGNAANEAGNQNLSIFGSVIMSCTAGDIVLLHLQIYNSTKTIDIDFQNSSDTRNWYSGYLIC
jgi:hypothetical protein